jgi:hypothetical protein
MPRRVSLATIAVVTLEEIPLAKPNYSFEKRQRELAKKKKQQAKLDQKRQQKQPEKTAGADGEPATETPPAESNP